MLHIHIFIRIDYILLFPSQPINSSLKQSLGKGGHIYIERGFPVAKALSQQLQSFSFKPHVGVCNSPSCPSLDLSLCRTMSLFLGIFKREVS